MLPMRKIALSYRRSDSAAITGRIFDRLAAHYGRDAVFMDIDGVPYGTDFRAYVQEVWRQTDIVIVVIGMHWLEVDAASVSRLSQEADPVRVEIESALALQVPLIPVLVDGARMPSPATLPESLKNFAFLNAAEVSSGRDFHAHLGRLIAAIDGTLAAPTPGIVKSLMPQTAASSETAPVSWPADLVRYLLVPLVILLVAQHVIVNSLDLNFEYLRAVSIGVPFAFGFALYWLGARSAGAALALALTLGVIAVSGMTISEGLNSGQPILPQTRFEWKDNIEYVVTIALSFIAGHALALALGRAMRRKIRRTARHRRRS
jgi:hypothetical protein